MSGGSPDLVTQPGATSGQRVLCPVSGVALTVKEDTPHRDVAGKPVYFCCASCASYFDMNREHVLALRGIAH